MWSRGASGLDLLTLVGVGPQLVDGLCGGWSGLSSMDTSLPLVSDSALIHQSFLLMLLEAS